MPKSLCSAFAHERAYPLLENEYKNGESQRSLQSLVSRKRWRLTKRLTPAQLVTLRTIYESCGGMFGALYFYDPYESSPRFSVDATGLSPIGRYTVRFACDWQQRNGPARSDVDLELIEIA